MQRLSLTVKDLTVIGMCVFGCITSSMSHVHWNVINKIIYIFSKTYCWNYKCIFKICNLHGNIWQIHFQTPCPAWPHGFEYKDRGTHAHEHCVKCFKFIMYCSYKYNIYMDLITAVHTISKPYELLMYLISYTIMKFRETVHLASNTRASSCSESMDCHAFW